MPFIPVNNTAMVELRYLWDGQQVENTLYFQGEATPAIGDLEDLAGLIIEWYRDNIRGQQGVAVSLSEVRVTSLEADDSPSVAATGISSDTGQVNSPSLPNSVSWAVQFQTQFRGRNARGRNYIIGLTEAQVTGSAIITAFADAYVTAYDQLLGGIGTPYVWTWVVVSRFNNGAPRVTGVKYPVTNVRYADLTIDSQRRRLPGRGS